MDKKWKRIVVAIFLMVSFSATAFVFAGADDLVKQADKITRNAERKMHSGKNNEADSLLNDAAILIEQVKAEDPNNNKIKRVEKNHVRIRKSVDKKLQATTNKSSTTAGASTTVVNTSDGGKLPGGVTKRLKDINRHLDSAERYASRDAQKAKYKLGQAEELFEEIERNYGGKFDPANPSFAAVLKRYKDLAGATDRQGTAEAQVKSDAAGKKVAQEKQSVEWVAKFHAYLSYPGQEGHNPDMLVYVPGTSEPEKFGDAQKHYENFKAFYEEYKNTDFPNGKTWQLEDLADNQAPMRLKDFEEGFASRVDSVSGYAEKEIDDAMRYLQKDNGWKSDKTIKPNLVDQRRMASIEAATTKVVTALGKSDSKGREIQAKFDALIAKDKANRQIRKERTFMIPDRYVGDGIGTLKKKAESLVKNNKKEGGKPLRCTVISENWQEQTVKEWTDTSKTTWRIRTTRSLTAQVAAKTSDGVRLITVALAKDKQSDGGWGTLYGNLHQYSDPMLESNIDK